MLVSVKTQAFYDPKFPYSSPPDDLQEITYEQFLYLHTAVNNDCIILPDLSISPAKPSEFHTWNGSEWIDSRTPEEVAQSLPTLSAKDFRHMLDRAGLRDDIELLLTQIEDPQVRRAIQNEYEYAQFFERTHPAVLYMIKLLELDDERVNAEWKTPISLEQVLPEIE